MNKDGSKPASAEAWTDYPLFRLGEIYLNLAEAVLRGGQGATKTEALGYVNDCVNVHIQTRRPHLFPIVILLWTL